MNIFLVLDFTKKISKALTVQDDILSNNFLKPFSVFKYCVFLLFTITKIRPTYTLNRIVHI